MKSKIRISRCLYIFVAYILFAVCTDVISLTLFYLLPAASVWISVLSAFIVTGFILYFTRQNFQFEKIGINGMMLFLITVFCVVGVVRSIIPDVSCDVLTARIFWQIPGFKDNIHDSFFPASMTFYFALPERLYYYPRMIFGYRFGTLLNTFSVILIYIEVKLFIDEFFKSDIIFCREFIVKKFSGKIKDALYLCVVREEMIAFIATATFYVIAATGTYMTDLIMVPILTYLLRMTLRNMDHVSSGQFLFYALLQGILFGLKLTNVIFIVPMLCVFLWKNRKYLRIWILITGVILALIPAAPYLLYCYTSTGNPVFWTFNKIFKSPYFDSSINFKDTRWGPESFVDGLLWPIHVILTPQVRGTEISSYGQCFFLVGHISAVIAIRDWLQKRVKDCLPFLLAVMYIIFFTLWLCSTGYQRYVIFIEIIAVLLFFAVVLKGKKLIQGKAIGYHVLTGILIVQCVFNVGAGFNNQYDWSWRGWTKANIDNKKLVENAKVLLQDRSIGNKEQRDKVDLFFTVCPMVSALTTLFDTDKPVINGYYFTTYLIGLTGEKDYYAEYKEKIANEIRGGKGVYDLVFLNQLPEAVNMANQWGLSIRSIETVDAFFMEQIPVLIEYGLKEDTANNLLLAPGANSLTCEKSPLPADCNSYIYITPYWGMPAEANGKAEVTLQDGTVHKIDVKLKPGEVHKWESLIPGIDRSQIATVLLEVEAPMQINALNLI
ncbi:MAG: hypothetical protein J6C32_05420 [Eubacterium sp.]|nr:hypothetical protein [Eubacterium sp.]